MLLPKRAMMVGGAIVGLAVIYSMSVDPPNSATTPTSSDAKCRMAVTADVLNVRSAPEPNAEIVGKYKTGAESDAENVVQNGFRKLGENRWASAEFLKPLQGRNCG
ncbi:SH3 domain-containing protein [Actinokineospora auranticolor]|uniref:SH3 domain-containing protein n=1 Tax=Actinokineospora auranticolor TaxID=155976 RepID=A0A2S6GWR4_9PSEU|nr:SH3 domain-containing protein [Actinokineospora auranticolor]PPK69682.1 hypothetical protein CLV40_103292 [Actinokineospora auranticolor]